MEDSHRSCGSPADMGDMQLSWSECIFTTPTPSSSSSSAPVSGVTGNSLSETSFESRVSQEEKDLLLKLEAANRMLEADERSVASKPQPLHESPLVLDVPPPAEDSASIISSSSRISNLPDPGGTGAEEDIDAWGKILKDWQGHFKKRTVYIRDLVRKGIPHLFRYIVWQYLCSGDPSVLINAKELYANYLKQTSACEKVIRRDIARTYPEHDFFREKDGIGQESLFNVMKAYSLHDREVGYCQGIGFIVGLFLMLMPEEEAFGVLVQIMNEYRMRELFKPSMAELGLCMYQLEFLIQESMPGLYKHFQSQTFHTSMYASSWFLTLFTTTLPISLCFRIMDIFLSEGMEIIFRVGISILKESEADLLCLDMEGMLQYLNEAIAVRYKADAETLLKSAFQAKFNPKKMKKLEKEYVVLKAKENEDQVELRRLRSENRLLKHRIANLEKENVTLAEKLIQGQVSQAQAAEESYVLKHELSQSRDQICELARIHSMTQREVNRLSSSQNTEDAMLLRIREAENTQVIAGLKQKIIELEIKNHELVATHEIVDTSKKQTLQNEITDLKDEILQCKLQKKPLSFSTLDVSKGCFDSDSESETGPTPDRVQDSHQLSALSLITPQVDAINNGTSLTGVPVFLGGDSDFISNSQHVSAANQNDDVLVLDKSVTQCDSDTSISDRTLSGGPGSLDPPRHKLSLHSSMKLDSMDSF